MRITNPNCDGAKCVFQHGQVRKLPTGGSSNAILCRACFERELVWRRERNRELEKSAQFDLPKWEELEVYEV